MCPAFGLRFGPPGGSPDFRCEEGVTRFGGPAQASWTGGPNEGFSSIPLKIREPPGIVTEVGSPACLLCQTQQRWGWPSHPEGAQLVGPAGTEGVICDAALP